jgi:hypothetical protein
MTEDESPRGSKQAERPSAGTGLCIHCVQRTESAIVAVVRNKGEDLPVKRLRVSVPSAPERPVEGWWRDPHDPGLMRYHDGTSWTEFVQRLDGSGVVPAGQRVEVVPIGAAQDQISPEYLADPAPDPPVRGWWLDPDDPARVRFHDGQRWTDHVGRSTAPRPGVPGYQGIFWLGTGRGGISLGRPLAPGSGRYFSQGQLYWFILAMIVGLTVFPAGFILGGWPGWLMVGVGAVCLYQGFIRLAIGSWRAGFRIPGFRRDSTAFERILGFAAVGAIGLLLWGFISAIISPGHGRP